jgi:hypothetical protein
MSSNPFRGTLSLRIAPSASILLVLLLAAGCGKSSTGTLGQDGGTQGGGALTLVTQTLPDGRVGEAYSAVLQASGGQSPYTFALGSASSLPQGLTLGTDGTISGTPSAAGSARFVVALSDNASPPAQVTGTLMITIDPMSGSPLQISTTMLPNGKVGMAYSVSFAASGGTTPYVWTIARGTLPQGIALTADGKLSGNPTVAGTSSFTVQVTDASSPGQMASAALMLTIDPMEGTALAITTVSLPNGKVGVAYSAQLAASGGMTPYTWTLAAGSSLPPGLTMSSAGSISGMPTQVGMTSFTVQVSDVSMPNQVASAPLSITIDPTSGTALMITTTALPNGVVGHAYAGQLAASGGSTPYQWMLDPASALPPGLLLSASGAIAGSPTTRGRYAFTVVASDASSPRQSASGSVTLTVTSTSSNLTITTLGAPDAVVGTPYRLQLAARGGLLPYQWSIVAGSLPTGLMLDAAGLISGTASVTGAFSFNVEVTDSAMPAAHAEATLRILSLPAGTQILAITTRALSTGTEGRPYAAQLQATGGTAPLRWMLTNGMLPPGLTLSSTGAIFGTPNSTGAFAFTVLVGDSGNPMQTAQRQIFLAVFPNPNGLAITNAVLRNGVVGQAYRAQFMVTGGRPPYALSLGSGTLPPGLNIDAMQLTLTGTPSQSGTFDFTLRATDSSNPQLSTQHTYALTINAAPTGLAITTMSLPPARVNMTYTATLTATRGTMPYTWSLANGTLPAGLMLGTNGIIHGTPTQGGFSSFRVQVVDSATPPATASRRLFLMVR